MRGHGFSSDGKGKPSSGNIGPQDANTRLSTFNGMVDEDFTLFPNMHCSLHLVAKLLVIVSA